MSFILIAEQVLNGLQFGIMLFLMAAGLTLIFGVMGLINLAHGSLYMVGAFAAAAVAGATGSFVLALAAAMAAALYDFCNALSSLQITASSCGIIWKILAHCTQVPRLYSRRWPVRTSCVLSSVQSRSKFLD